MVDGCIYVIGGWLFNQIDFVHIVTYTIETDAWATIPEPMAKARRKFAAITHKKKIYVIGGLDVVPFVVHAKTMEVFDTETSTWTIYNVPKEFHRYGIHNQVAVYKDEIYVFGGTSAYKTETVHQNGIVYNIASDTWRALPGHMSSVRSSFAVVCHGHTMMMIGGRLSNHDMVKSAYDSETFNVLNNAWGHLQDHMCVPRESPAAVMAGDLLYVVGGDHARTNTHIAIEVSLRPSRFGWAPSRHWTFPRSFRAVVHALMLTFARTSIIPEEIVLYIITLV